MKTSAIFAAVVGAALAAAQLDQIPTCALSCAITSIGASGCPQTDIACICQAAPFLSGILSCIQGACSASEIEQTLKAAQGLCLSAGVTITVPGGTPSTTAPPPASTSSAPEPTETSTEIPESTTSTTVEPVPTTAESTSGVVTMTTYTTICPPTTTVVPTYVPPPAQNTTVAVPPPAYTGAAGSIAANAGTVLFGAALAMFFA